MPHRRPLRPVPTVALRTSLSRALAVHPPSVAASGSSSSLLAFASACLSCVDLRGVHGRRETCLACHVQATAQGRAPGSRLAQRRRSRLAFTLALGPATHVNLRSRSGPVRLSRQPRQPRPEPRRAGPVRGRAALSVASLHCPSRASARRGACAPSLQPGRSRSTHKFSLKTRSL